jgi:ribonuclease HI
MEKIIIYTDGGCRGNPGIGGWGVFGFAIRTHGQKNLKGAELNTTNNKMELTASIRALQTP